MFLVAGVNGSGKSSFTHNIKRRFPRIKIIDPDAIARTKTGSASTIDAESLSAGKLSLMEVQRCINEKQPFIVESTISGRVYLRYLKEAKAAGFKVIVVYVALNSPELSAERVKNRVKLGGHNIPIEDIKRRYPKSFKNLKAHLNLSDLAYIVDNSNHYRQIASYRDGVLVKRINIPSFIKEYL
jgi:predicted ABC-type ATPase